jgi:phospholipid-binding lipoprotein MlaA
MADRIPARTPTRLVVGFALFAALLWLGLSSSATARPLPPDLVEELRHAADEGRAIESRLGPRFANQPPLGNRRLNATVVGAIAEHPDLAYEIVNAAVAADPAAREVLLATVHHDFPGLVGSPGVDTVKRHSFSKPVTHQGVKNGRGDDPPPRPAPPGQRPASWPVLPEEGGVDGYAKIDPLEGMNKVFFYVNGAFDYVVMEPIAHTYHVVVPAEARAALLQAYNNLSSPLVFANDLLQLEFKKAGITLGRFIINSTLGIAGLLDVANMMGMPPHHSDFGQTLARYGAGPGIYLVLPLLGPTTTRDAVGTGASIYVNPVQFVFDSSVIVPLTIGEAVVRRDEVLGPSEFLRYYAANPYNAVRAWTYQQRQRLIKGDCDRPVTVVCAGALAGR